jgi:chromosome segregation ATPase
VAVCANRPQLGNPTFVYVPRAANVLRERERHIALLETELGTKDQWLDKAVRDLAEFDREHRKLMAMYLAIQEELERANQWAASLNQEMEARGARVVELQEEMAAEQERARHTAEGYAAKVAELEADIRAKVQWAADLNAEVRKQTGALVATMAQLQLTEKELEERTAWALQLQEEARLMGDQVALFRASRWVKLGRKVGLGPDLPAS